MVNRKREEKKGSDSKDLLYFDERHQFFLEAQYILAP